MTCPAQDLQYRFRISTSAKIMTNDQLDQQVVELDNLNEHREIVTFMRRSSPLNTSQRTALEQYGHMILEYPVGDLRQQFEHPERPLTVEIGFGMGRSLVLMAQANPDAEAGDLAARYPKAQIRDYDGDPKRVTEMDALVAYLQMLGTLVDFSTYDDATGYR